MKLAYSVRNLRRLTATPEIEIRPITILLGRNSVGKSTFLRSFPLLRQSIETRSSAPILWYGDFVDFGDFKSAVFQKDEGKFISFDFALSDYTATLRPTDPYRSIYGSSRARPQKFDLKKVRISYSICSRTGSTERQGVRIEIPRRSSVLEVKFERTGTVASAVFVNGERLDGVLSDYEVYFPADNIFSTPHFLQKVRDNKSVRLTARARLWVFANALETELAALVDGRTSEARVSSEARRILSAEKLDDKTLDGFANAAETATFRQIYISLKNRNREQLRAKLNAICQAHHLFNLIEIIGETLSDHFRSVEYIGPARVRSERFYRQQELQVSEIAPDGRNLPIFLASLSMSDQKGFSDWVEKLFGFGVKVHKTEGHISINLEQAGQSVNVVDTGYGVSQVLPVLAQIWWMKSTQRDRRYRKIQGEVSIKTLAIEQPELHLHPAHQALLADVFVEAMSRDLSADVDIEHYFLVETHSESLINRLGELIANGEVAASNVQIIIFGGEKESGSGSEIQVATFDDKGVLVNWPYGFFNY